MILVTGATGSNATEIIKRLMGQNIQVGAGWYAIAIMQVNNVE